MIALRYRNNFWSKLDPKTKKAIYNLSLRNIRGLTMPYIIDDKMDPYFVMLWSDNQLDGWAALFLNIKEIHIYVRKIKRKRGIGKRLLEKISNIAKNRFNINTVYVMPWDKRSQEFYNKALKKRINKDNVRVVRNNELIR